DLCESVGEFGLAGPVRLPAVYQPAPDRRECPSTNFPVIVIHQRIVGDESDVRVTEGSQQACRLAKVRVLDVVSVREVRTDQAQERAQLLAAPADLMNGLVAIEMPIVELLDGGVELIARDVADLARDAFPLPEMEGHGALRRTRASGPALQPAVGRQLLQNARPSRAGSRGGRKGGRLPP